MDAGGTYQGGTLHLYEFEGLQRGSACSKAVQNIEIRWAEFEFQNSNTCGARQERGHKNEQWSGCSAGRLVYSDAGNRIIPDEYGDTSEWARNITKVAQLTTIKRAWLSGASTALDAQESDVLMIFEELRDNSVGGIGSK